MEKCSACGAPLQNGTCAYCGATSASAQAANMPGGGQQTPYPTQPQPGSNQGVPVTNPYTNVPLKSKWTAFLLCFFLGYLGIHNFYVGKIGMGILYLLTLGLFGFGWVIDIFRILLNAFRDSYGRELQG